MSLWRNGGKSWPRRGVIQMVRTRRGISPAIGYRTDLHKIAFLIRTVPDVGARMAVTIAVLGEMLSVGVVEGKMMMMVQHFPSFSRAIVKQGQLQQMILAGLVEECLPEDHQLYQIVLVNLRLQSVEERQMILVRLQAGQQRLEIRLQNPIRLKLTCWGF